MSNIVPRLSQLNYITIARKSSNKDEKIASPFDIEEAKENEIESLANLLNNLKECEYFHDPEVMKNDVRENDK